MKKLFGVAILILAVCFLAGGAQAQIWYPANQATVAWDPVTTIDNGSPLPAGDVIKYHLWATPSINMTKANPTDMGTTEAAQMTLSFPTEGRYFLGVQTERWVAGAMESSSIIAWSDDQNVCADAKTFGVKYYLPPGVAHGLKKAQAP